MKPFSPPGWLRNAHLQSILPSFPGRKLLVGRRVAAVKAASRELLLDCGDGVTLHALHSAASRADREAAAARLGIRGATRSVVVLLHGWEGSSESLYILSLAQSLHEAGHDVVRLNLRDHGPTHHLNREIFHSCRLADVVGAVRALQAKFDGEPLQLVGFSLGGNFMLRVAADAEREGLRIGHVVAISPVLDPSRTLDALENGFKLYHEYFVRKWTRSLHLKQAAWPKDYDFNALLRTRDLRNMTADLVREYTTYPTLENYLSGYALTGDRLASLRSSATLITAIDDPIIPSLDLEHLARSDSLRVITTDHGGHCGFIERLGANSWVNALVLAELDQARSMASDQRA